MAIKVSPAIARLQSDEAGELLLEAVGYKNAVPQESGGNGDGVHLHFTDAGGVGRTVTYTIHEDRFGVCELKNINVERNGDYDQPPINQHELLMCVLDLEKDHSIETKRQMADHIIRFMRHYK